ncbi:uncharacterized protein ACMZJ9_016211 isoform 2-T2 [Mantella aurantiaca]
MAAGEQRARLLLIRGVCRRREKGSKVKEEMEVCEDMSVDPEVVNMRKRHCMDGVLDHPLNKRTCHGLQSLTNGNGVLLTTMTDCGMTFWQMEVSNGRREPINGLVFQDVTQPDIMPPQNHQNVVSPQVCQRCMAGESGHINHILGL